jgi:hypothetical protein
LRVCSRRACALNECAPLREPEPTSRTTENAFDGEQTWKDVMTKGTYGGGTWGSPWGLGFGMYVDSLGRFYPQAYFGSRKFSVSAGSTDDLEGLLTGLSVAGTLGMGPVGVNIGRSGNANGYGFGTPGAGMTYGFGPYGPFPIWPNGPGPRATAPDYGRPWMTPAIRDSVRGAGIPDRYNVWEYDYPDSKAAQPSPPISGDDSSATTQPLGLPGRIAPVSGVDPSDPTQAVPPTGGLLGLIQDYMRNQALQGGNR